MPKVALVALEPASPELNGVQVMARALDAVARANVEVLLLSSSSYRQNFCFLVREEELSRTLEALESALVLELAHHYLKPIHVDRDVGLLAAVGEGMQGHPGLAGRIFTAISRAHVNVIAIAQGSSELTIAVVVQARRAGERRPRGARRMRSGRAAAVAGFPVQAGYAPCAALRASAES
jgi:bifunctional aspartokinase / homoserine dehydrogenase 1